jgi:hypothetical protein
VRRDTGAVLPEPTTWKAGHGGTPGVRPLRPTIATLRPALLAASVNPVEALRAELRTALGVQRAPMNHPTRHGAADVGAPMLQGTLDLMVLKTLETMGPQHGYGIARRIEQISEQAHTSGSSARTSYNWLRSSCVSPNATQVPAARPTAAPPRRRHYAAWGDSLGSPPRPRWAGAHPACLRPCALLLNFYR